MDYSRTASWDTLEFQLCLLGWFESWGRGFPWRDTRDPFAIIVAEKLLQQTRVRDDVVFAYQTILTAYPTPEALSSANVADLEEMVRPLGLKYRAAELKTMAIDLVNNHEGRVPDDLQQLLNLTGVGSYSARAVLSFAYGADMPVVDTNVARILYRVFAIQGDMPANPARKKSLIELAGSILPDGHSREFNFALLDLGALVCVARSPNCLSCPVAKLCVYGERFI